MTGVYHCDTREEYDNTISEYVNNLNFSYFGTFDMMNDVYYKMEVIGYTDEQTLKLSMNEVGKQLIIIKYVDEYTTFLGEKIKSEKDDKTMTNSTLKVNALAKELEVNINDINETSDTTFEIDGYEYLVLDEGEREEHVNEAIKESLFAFNTSFLSYQTNLDEIIFQVLSEKYEDANESILKLINLTCGFDNFVTAASDEDGYGHFLSSYDGDELELQNNFYAYRIN